MKGSDHCLSFCFPAFPCGSTALTAARHARHQLLGPPQVVSRSLQAHPLMVELWRRDSYENDVCLGLALLQLHDLVDAPVTVSRAVAPAGAGQSAHVQTYDRYFELLAPGDGDGGGGAGRPVGSVRVVLQLEDFGPSTDELLDAVQQQQQQQPAELPPQPLGAGGLGDAGGSADFGGGGGGGGGLGQTGGAEVGRDGVEDEVAWQLEQWKRVEEARWQAELRQRESDRMDQVRTKALYCVCVCVCVCVSV
eukprot:SAG22_NODE_4667_length_1199_cov_1.651818_2_plen_249_part_01